MDPAGFEVVVADDGSSDDTAAVVESFRDRLSLKYYFHEDLGFRLSAVRNGGVRLATAPLLVFLDTGTFVGRNFVRAHLDAHRAAPQPVAIAGYTYGYDPNGVDATLTARIDQYAPDGLVQREADNPGFWDARHALFDACEFDLTRLTLPWQVFYTLNCSVRADVLAEVGGFDEVFEGWGFEDCELGFRLHRAGVAIRLSREAWAVESSHARDPGRWKQLERNMDRFFTKYPEPVLEIGWVLIMRNRAAYWTWEAELRSLDAWTAEVRDLDVAEELAATAEVAALGETVAVFGAGARVPASLPPAVLFDFDPDLVQQAVTASGGRHTGHRAIGLRTTLPDQAVDSVIITSRMRGLWGRWESDLLAEARRIGRTVHVFGSLT
jgi:GT2 family glycosyltransferase